jgi:adsorption protein B
MVAGGVAMLPQILDWLQLVEHELLLFAAFWFVVGALDQLAVDTVWLCLWLVGCARDGRLPKGAETLALSGKAAVFVPAWAESQVIGHMVAHALRVWPQRELMLYVGCYCNDPATVTAAMAGAGDDPRVRIVINDRPGPTTKADCLNRLYAALILDEARSGVRFSSIILHDAEDMVHPAALVVMDQALSEVEFVQLPVRPEPQPASFFVAGHYTDEFTESHGKEMVVRGALGTALPAAGVGCGFGRETLARLAALRAAEGAAGPFATECLTEDYELGVLVYRGGGKSRFLRLRDANGELVATRAYFPAELDAAVRQKARWIHGIAFQGWDRLGWSRRPLDIWMALRDRQGPLTAAVLAAAYLLLPIDLVLRVAQLFGWHSTVPVSPTLRAMLSLSVAASVWRATWRFGFTAHEYGLIEGMRSLLRIPVANVIAILAGRRALTAYVGTLRGKAVRWEKTDHSAHPASSGVEVLAS